MTTYSYIVDCGIIQNKGFCESLCALGYTVTLLGRYNKLFKDDFVPERITTIIYSFLSPEIKLEYLLNYGCDRDN